LLDVNGGIEKEDYCRTVTNQPLHSCWASFK
jgi:hypothetical protein